MIWAEVIKIIAWCKYNNTNTILANLQEIWCI